MTQARASRLIQLGFLLLVLLAWYWVGETRAVSPLFLPPMGATWTAFYRLAQTAQFWSAVQTTLVTIVKAYAIAAVLGVLAGYLITRSRLVTEMLEPIVAGMFAIPITLFFPLFILFFGIGTGSKVAYGAVNGFFPIALNTIAGLAAVEERWLRPARSMGFSRFGTFRHVLLPASLPVILTGLRIGFFIAFASVLGGETISSVAGVGRNIALQAELMAPARMFAWIVFVIAVALALNALLAQAEQRVPPQ